MPNETKHDPIRELNELREQLSYSKRISFFLGAGTSKSIGLSDIKVLTDKVESNLKLTSKKQYQKIKQYLEEVEKNGNKDKPSEITIENILNQVRLIRDITFEDKSKNFDDINGKEAKDLDIEICNEIYSIIIDEEKGADISNMQRFCSWFNWFNKDFQKEIFTTNYDLILERTFESIQVPYYDGFVGANEPFFLPESLERQNQMDRPPNSWIRLWKLHGSLGWFWQENNDNKTFRVVRLGINAKKYNTNELVIYPSKEKYETSRKQPFVAYFDRLKSCLYDGEGLLIVNGYSFSDEHINAVIFDGLKQNNRLHLVVLFFSDNDLEKVYRLNKNFMNFTALGKKKAIVQGVLGVYEKQRTNETLEPFWDDNDKSLLIGDFNEFIKFLLICSGKEDKIESMIRS